MSSFGKKIILNLQRSKDKQYLKEKYGKTGQLFKIIKNRSKLNKQIDETLNDHLIKYKLNGPGKLIESVSANMTAYEELKEKIDKLKLTKTERDYKRTAKLRAHHLTNFLSNYLINSFQSGYIGSELNNKYPSFQISRLLLTVDFHRLEIFWLTSIDEEANKDIEKNYLPKLAKQIRHELISNRVIGFVPPVVFLRDNSKVILDQLEELLLFNNKKDNYDSTNKNKNEDNVKNENLNNNQPSSTTTTTTTTLTTSSTPINNVYGIDHQKLLNKIINPNENLTKKEVDEIISIDDKKKKYDLTIKAMKINQKLKKEKESKSALIKLAFYDFECHKESMSSKKNKDDDLSVDD